MKIIYNKTTKKITTWNASHVKPRNNEEKTTVAEDKLIEDYPLYCHEYSDGHIILSDDADEQLLNEAKNKKIKAIISKNSKLPSINWNGGVWDYSEKSDYKDVYDAVNMGIATEPVEVYDSQNKPFNLTKSELNQLLTEFFSAMRSRVNAGSDLINSVKNCKTIEEVNAIKDNR
jgi:hypothetical protein